MRFTLEITNEFMSGHGVFPDRWRVTVYAETEYRPIMGSTHNIGSFDRAVELGKEMFNRLTKEANTPERIVERSAHNVSRGAM